MHETSHSLRTGLPAETIARATVDRRLELVWLCFGRCDGAERGSIAKYSTVERAA